MVIMFILFMVFQCHGAEQIVPRAVKKILVLEDKLKNSRQQRGVNPSAVEKEIMQKLADLPAWKCNRYLRAVVLNEQELLERVVVLEKELEALNKKKFTLSWVDALLLRSEAIREIRTQFDNEVQEQKDNIKDAKKNFVERLSLEGYQKYLTEKCGVLICNKTVLALGNREDLRFPPGIISIILSYMAHRTRDTVIAHPSSDEQRIDTRSYYPVEDRGYHIFADTASRQEYYAQPPCSITFMNQDELLMLGLFGQNTFNVRFDRYRRLHPHISPHEAALHVKDEEDRRLDALVEFDISPETIALAKEERLVTVPSPEEILLRKDRAGDAFYVQVPLKLPLANRIVKLKDNKWVEKAMGHSKREYRV